MSKPICHFAGFLPPFLLVELAQHNPKFPHYAQTLIQTQKLWADSFFVEHPTIVQHSASCLLAECRAKIEIYDAKRRTDLPGVLMRVERHPSIGDRDVDRAYKFSETIRRYYLDVHGRLGTDGCGGKKITTVRYGVDFNNAFWNSRQVVFGTGDQIVFKSFVLLDVNGHEETHGVTEYEVGAAYWGMAGALNEHYADVEGEGVEMYAKKSRVENHDWIVGKGIFMPEVKGTGIRNMLNPGTAYNDFKLGLGKDPQSAHMDKYIRTVTDCGGVHYNNGIPNRAYALFAISVGGYAWEVVNPIWYAARKMAGKNPSFWQFAYCTVEAARSLGHGQLVDKLLVAWDLVGIKPDMNRVDDLTPSLSRYLNRVSATIAARI